MSDREILNKLSDRLVNQDIEGCKTTTLEALDAGISAFDAINEGLSVGMKIVGDKYELGELYLPHIMMSAKAMDAAMEILTPILEKEGTGENIGTAITFVQEGDIHEIGHRLVSIMLGVNGFNIVDLGVDVSNKTIIEEINKHNGDKILLAGSALMTTSMQGQKDTVTAIEEQGLRDSVKIMFGGAPVSEKWVKDIRADATAKNAADAARVAVELMK
ncbi:methyltransferase cognate corrinoid protein [Methanolobus bombayensis]|uniref:methyltransferase cognate corrinoid protein n=1 Tax=Methanolobus bombayensis TaxID=38023 RepID=UPI001AE68DC8|nr:methyltransferase cognate corrinoid protein [Methanolobus bombayensis]MBP1907943.1 monomethylamine corrinoid protein [Methanolobus bombayensis]